MRNRSKYAWVELIEGILLIIVGLISFIHPASILRWAVIIYGIMAVITGVVDIVFYAKTERYVGIGPTLSLVTGVLSILAGLMLLCYPNAGVWIISLLMPIWFIAHSISRLTHLNFIRIAAGPFYYYFTLILNVFGIILGFIMIISPNVAIFSVGFIIGIYLILLGVDSIVLACSKFDSGWH